MDLRPQAHDIIRTWLFDTVLRAHLEHDSLPWTNAAISGWVLDPDRKKMSKSKGNVVTPMALLEEHGSDGVRYWAASGRPGHRHGVRPEPDEGRPAAGDQAAQRVEVRARRRPSRRGRSPRRSIARCCASLAALVDEATAAFEDYDYARVLQRTETFFWRFCDDYLELVKGRRYGEQGAEGAGVGQRRADRGAVGACCGCSRRSCRSSPKKSGRGGRRARSTRRRGRRATSSSRCSPTTRDGDRGRPISATYEWATDVLFEVRKQRSEAKQPLKVPITKVTDHGRRRRGRADAAWSKPTCGRRCACRRSRSPSASRATIVVAGYETRRQRAMTARHSIRGLSRPRPPRARRRRAAAATSRPTRPFRRTQRARGVFLVKADCVLAGPRRRVRGVPAARARRAGRRAQGATASAVAPGDDRRRSRRIGAHAARRRAHRAQLPAAAVGHRDARPPVRRRGRRPHHRPRHAQDHADAARAREVRRARRRRARIIASACSTRS